MNNNIKTNIKLKVTPEQSRKVQEICFANGIYWGDNSKKVELTDKPYLYIGNKLGLTLAYSNMVEGSEDGLTFFEKDQNEEVSAELFINTNGTCVETETTQQKTFSEFLKENNAYEAFVENCVEEFLKDMVWFECFKNDNEQVKLDNIFVGDESKQGRTFWSNLSRKLPDNLNYDMNKVIFAKVEKIINFRNSPNNYLSQEEIDSLRPKPRYLVFVSGKATPRKIHDSLDSAKAEAKRLSSKEVGFKISVLEIVAEFQSKVIVEEL